MDKQPSLTREVKLTAHATPTLEVTKIETHKTLQCRCCAKEGPEMHGVLRYGLKLYITKITMSNLCPMCETVFSKLETARIHEVKAVLWN